MRLDAVALCLRPPLNLRLKGLNLRFKGLNLRLNGFLTTCIERMRLDVVALCLCRHGAISVFKAHRLVYHSA